MILQYWSLWQRFLLGLKVPDHRVLWCGKLQIRSYVKKTAGFDL